uniref:Uncharacterized protein n=1 Tax=Lygus hesperus TaxID=30085 RepID=A0A0A9XWI2_LYGHE
MIFQAVLFVLAASESLATPSQSFLHHVELPVSKPDSSEGSGVQENSTVEENNTTGTINADGARQKRAAQEDSLGDLLTLPDKEMPEGKSTEATTTLKMAADTPEGFSMDPVLLERTRRLYVRSVDNETPDVESNVAPSAQNATSNSADAPLDLAVAPPVEKKLRESPDKLSQCQQ